MLLCVRSSAQTSLDSAVHDSSKVSMVLRAQNQEQMEQTLFKEDSSKKEMDLIERDQVPTRKNPSVPNRILEMASLDKQRISEMTMIPSAENP